MFVEEKKLFINVYNPFSTVDVILKGKIQHALLNTKYRKAAIRRIGKKHLPELILVTNSDAGNSMLGTYFTATFNVSVTLIINDGSVGDLIDK